MEFFPSDEDHQKAQELLPSGVVVGLHPGAKDRLNNGLLLILFSWAASSSKNSVAKLSSRNTSRKVFS